jgi:flavorubredoxin
LRPFNEGNFAILFTNDSIRAFYCLNKTTNTRINYEYRRDVKPVTVCLATDGT